MNLLISCVNSAKPLADTGTDEHKLEGAVYSSDLSFRKCIPRAINSPLPSRK